MDKPNNLITPHPTTPPTNPPQPNTPPSHSSTPIPLQPDTHPSHSLSSIPTLAQTQSHAQTVDSHTLSPINNSSQPISTHPMVTRAKAGIFKPLCHVTTTLLLPRSHVHALRDPNWKEAMLDEYSALITNKTWVLVPLEILERAHMQNCNPCRTPVDTESKLGSDGDPVSDPTLYRSLAGALQYLTFTRPDLSYAVQQLHVSSTTQLSAYTDADWAGCPVTRRSTSGAEAEYQGVSNVVAETAWVRNLLCELHTPLYTATLVYYDNVSDVYIQVRVLHVPSRFQYADIFTKGLPTALFIEFRFSLNVRRSPAHTEEEY
uniref:Ribonuclease H-like domain-containing protein n=1 Tax=Tanacetum cinerariifolium TaxID=118510 RepID=A0A6L2MCP1_TANCI|nr:ribonuclease H-like domain-containing protein [Tanacetum cinerariifolium]